jgi:hypothetical protein
MICQIPKISSKHQTNGHEIIIGQTRSKDLGEKISEFLET